jgi:hypothetical protein
VRKSKSSPGRAAGHKGRTLTIPQRWKIVRANNTAALLFLKKPLINDYELDLFWPMMPAQDSSSLRVFAGAWQSPANL